VVRVRFVLKSDRNRRRGECSACRVLSLRKMQRTCAARIGHRAALTVFALQFLSFPLPQYVKFTSFEDTGVFRVSTNYFHQEEYS